MLCVFYFSENARKSLELAIATAKIFNMLYRHHGLKNISKRGKRYLIFLLGMYSACYAMLVHLSVFVYANNRFYTLQNI